MFDREFDVTIQNSDQVRLGNVMDTPIGPAMVVRIDENEHYIILQQVKVNYG